ncbi:MAG: glycosyltransferase family 1 protein, partial [Actinomycetes bacterium]
SDRSSLPEVAGDAALLVDPSRSDLLAEAITEVAADDGARARFISAGRDRARRFTWQRTAEEMMEAFEQALVANARGSR